MMPRLPYRAILALSIAALVLAAVPGGASAHTHAVPRSQAAPVFVFPSNGQSFPLNGAMLFQVQPMSGAVGYLWSFVQNDAIVYQDAAWDGRLSSTTFSVKPGSTIQRRLQPGDLQVWVRAVMDSGHLSASSAVTVNLQGNRAQGQPTPGPTATPSPAARSRGRELYEANWAHGRDGWPGSAGWAIVAGMLVSTGKQDGVLLAPYHPGDAGRANYAVEAQIQWVRGRNFGLAVRTDPNGEGGYHAALAYGQAAIWLGANDAVHKPYKYDAGWHTYRVTVDDDHIAFSIDGSVVARWTDNTYLSGGDVGIYSYDGTQINVRSFKVMAL